MELTCPKCHGTMRTYERSGVTVDQCGDCRGIFLDRGELERLVDAESAWHTSGSAPAARARSPQPSRYEDDDDEDRGYGRSDHDDHRRPRKKRSFLEDLFD